MVGEPLQIVKINGNNDSLEVDENLLSTIFSKEIKDRYVSVISIAGAFRKGKSFLLNFFLKFMYNKYVHKGVTDFLGDENIPLTGFSWRNGVDPDTTGILMWSDVFLHDYENGDKVAIILLDTQGTFDHNTTVKGCASIFALSTMLSSVQLYNISQQINENDLQFLEFFIEYGKLAMEMSDKKPFQNLMFLVRDWCHTEDYDFGNYGGLYYVRKVLKSVQNNNSDLNILRESIKDCFMNISGFLMPHPGLNVAREPNFNGCLKDIDDEFKRYLRELIPMLLLPENLIIKEVNGVKLQAKGWIQCVKSFVGTFKENAFPDTKTMFAATSEVSNEIAVTETTALYNDGMMELLSDEDQCVPVETLENYHAEFKEKSLLHFDLIPKLGNEEIIRSCRESVENVIEQEFEKIKMINKGKSLIIEVGLLDEINAIAKNYSALLDETFGESKPYINMEDLNDFHFKTSNDILSSFIQLNKKVSETERYREQLQLNLNAAFSIILKLNETKLCHMETCALKWFQSVLNAYIKKMDSVCQNYIEDIHEKHLEMKEEALAQFVDIKEITEENCNSSCEKLDKIFQERFEYYSQKNSDNLKKLETTIVNVALSCKLAFTNVWVSTLTESNNLSVVDLSVQLSTKRNDLLIEFDTKCEHINSGIWMTCRNKLRDDMTDITEYALTNAVELERNSVDNRVRCMLRIAEFVGTLALGGAGKLPAIGTFLLCASRSARTIFNVN